MFSKLYKHSNIKEINYIYCLLVKYWFIYICYILNLSYLQSYSKKERKKETETDKKEWRDVVLHQTSLNSDKSIHL